MEFLKRNKVIYLPTEDETYWSKVSEALDRKLSHKLATTRTGILSLFTSLLLYTIITLLHTSNHFCKYAHTNTKEYLGPAIFEAIRSYRTDFNTSRHYYYNCRNLESALKLYQPICGKVSILISSLANVCIQSANEPHLSVNLLRTGKERKNKLSDKDVLTILAHAFFCTYKERDTDFKFREYPNISFIRLYTEEQSGSIADDVKVQKLMCLLAYFDIMLFGQAKHTKRTITYERVSISKKIPWSNAKKEYLSPIKFSKLPIEQSDSELQVDFANKRVGGGVIGNGTVQEEIYFITCPELIAARLFTEILGDDDVLFITGFETFSKFSGYSTSFKFKGRVEAFPSPAPNRRSLKSIVAMDALPFTRRDEHTQYKEEKVERELHKCQVAFRNGDFTSIASGNWGCGAFGGDPQLKLLLQWMAASYHNKKITFHMIDSFVKEDLEMLSKVATKHKTSIKDIYEHILNYSPYGKRKLLDYIIHRIIATSHMKTYYQSSNSKPRRKNDSSQVSNVVHGQNDHN